MMKLPFAHTQPKKRKGFLIAENKKQRYGMLKWSLLLNYSARKIVNFPSAMDCIFIIDIKRLSNRLPTIKIDDEIRI